MIALPFVRSITGVWRLMNKREHRAALVVCLFVIAKALADTFSVASVIPFLTVLVDPSIIETNEQAAWAYRMSGASSPDSFLVMLGFTFVGIIFLSGTIRAVTTYVVNRFVFMRQFTISRRMLSIYLSKPHEFYITNNTANLATLVLSETQRAVTEAIKPLADLVNHGFTLILLVTLLLFTQPMATLAAMVVLGGGYLLIYLATNSFLTRVSRAMVTNNKLRFRYCGEAFASIKEVRLASREMQEVDRFSEPALETARMRAMANSLRQVPRFGLEAIAFGGIVLFAVYSIIAGGGTGSDAFKAMVPVLGLFAFAGYRLMPAMHGVYAAASALRFGHGAVETVGEAFASHDQSNKAPTVPPEPLRLQKEISLRDIEYRYPGGETAGLSDINLSIKSGEMIGIVGSTGAGKSTLVDILLGILPPSKGQVTIDGVPLDRSNARNWFASIGYVPQDLVLRDGTLAENIAFASPDDSIDPTRLAEAVEVAQLSELIEELPEGLETTVGERGVRLSGGQKQRVGIARALYTKPDLLLFDEATSALDNVTEADVIQSIEALAGNLTIVMIAHRLTTLSNCDRIIVLEHGRIKEIGTYDALLGPAEKVEKVASRG